MLLNNTEDHMKRNVQVSVSLLSLLALLLISTGVSYSLVDDGSSSIHQEENEYSQTNNEEVRFLYTDYSGTGSVLSLTDDRVYSDSLGKILPLSDTNVFDFRINATTSATLPYQITLTKEDGSTLNEDFIKVYLTEVDGDSEEAISSCLNTDGSVRRFSQLADVDSALTSETTTEKLLYKGEASGNYDQNFRLRIWLADDVSATIQEDGTLRYTYQGMTFTVRVNVYTTLE